MKEHMFDSASFISMIGFLTTFKLGCDAIRIHEGAAMWVMPHFVSERVVASTNWQMIRNDGTAVAATIITPNRLASQVPRLRFYAEIVNHLQKRYVHAQTIADADAMIPRYTQPANIKPLQYGEDLFSKAVHLEDVYKGSALNNIFIEGIIKSIRHSLCEY